MLSLHHILSMYVKRKGSNLAGTQGKKPINASFNAPIEPLITLPSTLIGNSTSGWEKNYVPLLRFFKAPRERSFTPKAVASLELALACATLATRNHTALVSEWQAVDLHLHPQFPILFTWIDKKMFSVGDVLSLTPHPQITGWKKLRQPKEAI
jgi:hypothetical protein